MMYEYMVAPCRGESAIAKAINDKGREGWEPHILTFSGTELIERSQGGLSQLRAEPSVDMITKYCLVLRRPVQTGKVHG